MTPEQQHSLESIARSVRELTTLAQALTEGLQQQIAKGARMSRALAAVVVGLALGAGVIGYQVAELRRLAQVATENRAQITRNQEGIAALQERTSREVLCPLWELFLASYNPNSTNARESPLNYDDSFAVIERGAVTLGCAKTRRGK